MTDLEFKRMTTDIEAESKLCDCKRLIQIRKISYRSGRWIERLTPALNVRFISVTDQFDSKTEQIFQSVICSSN